MSRLPPAPPPIPRAVFPDLAAQPPAKTARLQRLSTGERSIALHVPMLASITAHYDGS
jgi:hypothetical protein